MTASQSIEETARIAESAIERMRAYGISPTPENYTVWFHYFSESDADLNRAIEVVLKSGHTVSAAAVSADLFERFFAPQESEIVQNAANRLDDVIQRTAGELNEAGQGAAAFGDVLADASGVLQKDPRTAGVAKVVQGVVAAAREMESRARDLEQRLEAASHEVNELRQEVETVRHEATTDALTGLANRKQFDTKLQEEAAAVTESGEPLSLVMFDLDHFKRFNDEHGHLVGDQVLRLLGEVVRQCIKGRDTAARFGGEEFCVILPGTSLINAKAVANTIRDRIAKKNIVNRRTGKHLGTITASAGVARYQAGEAVNQFIERADAALYRAKRSGRDRTFTELEQGDTRMAMGL